MGIGPDAVCLLTVNWIPKPAYKTVAALIQHCGIKSLPLGQKLIKISSGMLPHVLISREAEGSAAVSFTSSAVVGTCTGGLRGWTSVTH
jgi:hypothetical protein